MTADMKDIPKKENNSNKMKDNTKNGSKSLELALDMSKSTVTFIHYIAIYLWLGNDIIHINITTTNTTIDNNNNNNNNN